MARETNPADVHAAITPSDTTDIATFNGLFPRAVYVGVAGDVALVTTDGAALTYKNASAGQWLPVRVRRVNSTNTTATNMIALY